jgi:hypothetical protein
MRCWTPEEVRAHTAKARFASLDLAHGAAAGIAPDRLAIVARRSG